MSGSGHTKNFKLVIEYDGAQFNGWQIQASGRTVQGEIEKALSIMTRQHVRITGAGRTDAGVHALGQVAAFRCDTRITAEVFFSGLNSLLADDIVIRSCEAVADAFHPRFDATAKTYVYRILNRPLPPAVGRGYCWHIKKKLDISAIDQAIRHIVGTHDFKAFENTGSPRSHTVRKVFDAAVIGYSPGAPRLLTGCSPVEAHGFDPSQDIITIRITANGFLRYMVRNLVGTLVDVGTSKLNQTDFAVIMGKKNRSLASATAPPHGLFLVDVHYGPPPKYRR